MQTAPDNKTLDFVRPNGRSDDQEIQRLSESIDLSAERIREKCDALHVPSTDMRRFSAKLIADTGYLYVNRMEDVSPEARIEGLNALRRGILIHELALETDHTSKTFGEFVKHRDATDKTEQPLVQHLVDIDRSSDALGKAA